MLAVSIFPAGKLNGFSSSKTVEMFENEVFQAATL